MSRTASLAGLVWLLPALAGAASAVPVPEASPEALSYYRTDNLLWIASTLFGLLVPAAFLFTGLSARLRSWAVGKGRPWYVALAFYFAGFSLFLALVGLPLDFLQDFVREHAYGLSNQTLGKWAQDEALGFAVNTVLGLLFLWVPYLLLRKSPRRWWLYTTAAAIPFLLLVVMIAPVWLAPLFNKTGPMKDKALEAKILAFVARAGLEDGRLYEIETSVDSKRLNAAVVGFGGTKRIWITDTLLAKMNEDEVLFAVGHELGHYVLGHTVKLVLFLSALIAVTLYLASRAATTLVRRFQDRFGFAEVADIASLPLILLLANLFSLGVTPAFMAFNRHLEHEADRFGLEMTRANQAAATGFVTLQQENLRNPRPGPIYTLFRSSHPPLGERIDFANEYRPWAAGEALRYQTLFR